MFIDIILHRYRFFASKFTSLNNEGNWFRWCFKIQFCIWDFIWPKYLKDVFQTPVLKYVKLLIHYVCLLLFFSWFFIIKENRKSMWFEELNILFIERLILMSKYFLKPQTLFLLSSSFLLIHLRTSTFWNIATKIVALYIFNFSFFFANYCSIWLLV